MKNTNCPFQLIIKINTSGICFVDIDWAHNHNRINLEASNFKDISSSTIEKVKKLYQDGNTPSIARQVFLKDLKQSCNDEMTYHVMKADRSITPEKEISTTYMISLQRNSLVVRMEKCSKSWKKKSRNI